MVAIICNNNDDDNNRLVKYTMTLLYAYFRFRQLHYSAGARLVSTMSYDSNVHRRWPIFIGQPFVKRFALCYRTVVLSCPVCPVCLQRWCIVAKLLDGSR